MPFGAIASLASTAVGIGSAVSAAGSESSAVKAGQEQANALLSPYATTGTAANTQEANLLGLNGSDAATTAMSEFTSSPSYQYQVQQGLKAVDAGAASKGLLQSGGTAQAEETLGSNLANEDFTAYYNRLAGLSSTGLTAATSEAGVDTSTANSLAGITNAETTGINTALQSGIGNLTQNSLSSLGSGTGSTSTGSLSSSLNTLSNAGGDTLAGF